MNKRKKYTEKSVSYFDIIKVFPYGVPGKFTKEELQWLYQNLGMQKFDWYLIGGKFWFRHQEDALMFALRWS